MSSTELKLFEPSGKEVGKKTVPSEIFACEPVPGLLHQVVRWQRAKRRSGTHSTLTRTQVRGGGSKPWRQKGLGRARAGTSSSPVWVGGGVAHGPRPRDYEFRLNRKERKRALISAISARTREERCLLLTDFGLEEIKTRDAVSVLKALGISHDASAIIVLGDEEQLAYKSLRNIHGVKPIWVAGLNVYDILGADYLVVTQKALPLIEQRLADT